GWRLSFNLDVEREFFVQRFNPRLAESVTQPANDPQSAAPQNHLDSSVSLALTRRDAGDREVAIERAVQVFGFDADAPPNALFDVVRNEVDHFAAALADHAGHHSSRTGEAVILSVAAQQPHTLQTVEHLSKRFLPRAIEFEQLGQILRGQTFRRA